MCPRFSSEDPHLDMSMETYSRIHSAMNYAHTIDFTGWGEPLLHREIYKMISMANQQGCFTTMTSNGTALNKRNAEKLIDAELGKLTISVDGMRSATYDAIRIGASFEKVTANLARLSEMTERRNSSLELCIAFTIQEDNADELDEILPWMESIGARALHLKQLNVASNQEDWKNSLLKYRLEPRANSKDRLKKVESRIEKVLGESRARGVRTVMHSELPLSSQLVGRHCLATPLNSAYFSFEGRVSPCCHFGHHVSRFFEGEFYPPSSLYYGDIRSRTFEAIWTDPDFRKFRRGFETQDFPEECRTCYLLYGK